MTLILAEITASESSMFPWMELLWFVLPLPILFFALFWSIRSAWTNYRQCVSQYKTALSQTESIIEINQEMMVLQKETNRLLGELIETLKKRQG